ERRYGRPIISSFHGLWSLGGAAAGALTVLGLSAGIGYQAMLAGTAAAAAVAFACCTVPLLPPPAAADGGSGSEGRPAGIGLVLLGGAVAVLFSAAFVE